MKKIQFFLDKIIAPLIVAVLAPLLTSVASKLNTGNWFIWFHLIPKIVWLVFGLLIAGWIIIILILKRVRQLQKSGISGFVITTPYSGWVTIAKLNYVGVLWRARAPAPDPRGIYPPTILPSEIEIELPPRCPKCETEIEQSKSFWGGYMWKCFGCGFKKRNLVSYFQEAERAEKIVRRKWEKQENNSPAP